MGKWVLYTQPNYAHSKPTHLPPLLFIDGLNHNFYFIFIFYHSKGGGDGIWTINIGHFKKMLLSIGISLKPCCLNLFGTEIEWYKEHISISIEHHYIWVSASCYSTIAPLARWF